MNNPLTILGVIVSIILIMLVVEVFVLPDSRKRKRTKKQKKDKEPEEIDLTPWRNKVTRLQKKIGELTSKMEQFQAREKEYQKKLALEDVKNQKYQEKIKQEKNWQKREHELVEKINKELARAKEDLIKEQEAFSKEHQLKIALDRENKALQKDYQEELQKVKDLGKECNRLQSLSDSYRQEIAELKKDIIELRRTKEDTQWVAKSDFDQLKMQAKALQKQLDRLKREND